MMKLQRESRYLWAEFGPFSRQSSRSFFRKQVFLFFPQHKRAAHGAPAFCLLEIIAVFKIRRIHFRGKLPPHGWPLLFPRRLFQLRLFLQFILRFQFKIPEIALGLWPLIALGNRRSGSCWRDALNSRAARFPALWGNFWGAAFSGSSFPY